LSKRKKITYTDSSGKKHEISLFDTELTLGDSNGEEFQELKDELKLDDDVKTLASKIVELKGHKSNIYSYYEIGTEINRLYDIYRKEKQTGFRAKQKILERIIDETKEIKKVKGITVRQLRTMSDFANSISREQVKSYIPWSIYSEIFTHALNKRDKNRIINLVENKELTKRDEVRKWILINRK